MVLRPGFCRQCSDVLLVVCTITIAVTGEWTLIASSGSSGSGRVLWYYSCYGKRATRFRGESDASWRYYRDGYVRRRRHIQRPCSRRAPMPPERNFILLRAGPTATFYAKKEIIFRNFSRARACAFYRCTLALIMSRRHAYNSERIIECNTSDRFLKPTWFLDSITSKKNVCFW